MASVRPGCAFIVAATAAAWIGSLSPGQAQATPALSITQAWARATPGGARTAAVYLTITSHESASDRFVGGTTPIADDVQVHEMSMQNGVMSMRRLANGLVIAAQGKVTLKPSSYHIMLIGLKRTLKRGDSFPMTLSFATAGPVSVDVSVQAIGATSAAMNSADDMKPRVEMK